MSTHQTRATALIEQIRGKSSEVAFLAHDALCAATAHAIEHGDVTLCDGILDALGKGHDRKLVIDWLAEFGCASWNKKEAKFTLNKSARTKLTKNGVTYQGLIAQPRWDEFGKEKDELVREFDIIAKLRATVKGYENAKEAEKPTKNDWAADKIKALLLSLEVEHLTTEHE